MRRTGPVTCITRRYYDFALHCVMAFSAMAMWSETQMDRLRGLVAEVETLRRENSNRTDLDSLTGLLNQAALARRVEQPDASGLRGGGVRHG